MRDAATPEQVYSILADRHTAGILKMAYSGFPASSSAYVGNLSKKQFYMRLKKLREAGLVEKSNSTYRTTTLGTLIFNGHVRTLESILSNFWSLKAIDVLKARKDIPLDHRENVINDLLQSTDLKNIVNSTHLLGFTIIKDYKRLITETLKLLENARDEIYLASRYHDQHISAKLMEKFSKGVSIRLLDGNPEQSGLENRINAVLRTPPDKQAYDLVSAMIRSPKFSLRNGDVPTSFVVIDGNQVGYEIVSHANPQEFTIGIANYNDTYLAESFIKYFKTLEAQARTPRLLASIQGK